MEIYLPGDPVQPVGKVSVDSRHTGEFKATFTAMQPFDGLMLKAVAEDGGEPPLWMSDFKPIQYGRQSLALRGVRLELLPKRRSCRACGIS